MSLNVISPLLPSCWGFSFAFGHGVSFFGRIQLSPVDGCSVVSCNFGILTEDELMSFYSAIFFEIFQVTPYKKSRTQGEWNLMKEGRRQSQKGGSFQGHLLERIHTHTHTHILFQSPLQPIICNIGYYRMLSRVPCSISRSLLFIYFIYIYILMCTRSV